MRKLGSYYRYKVYHESGKIFLLDIDASWKNKFMGFRAWKNPVNIYKLDSDMVSFWNGGVFIFVALMVATFFITFYLNALDITMKFYQRLLISIVICIFTIGVREAYRWLEYKNMESKINMKEFERGYVQLADSFNVKLSRLFSGFLWVLAIFVWAVVLVSPKGYVLFPFSALTKWLLLSSHRISSIILYEEDYEEVRRIDV